MIFELWPIIRSSAMTRWEPGDDMMILLFGVVVLLPCGVRGY